MLALLGLSLYYMNYRAFAAHNAFVDSLDEAPLSRQLDLARRSYREAPGLTTSSRLLHVVSFASRWNVLDRQDQDRAFKFFVEEGLRAQEAEPLSHTLQRGYVVFLQKRQSTPVEIQQTDSYLPRLLEFGPWRVDTYQILGLRRCSGKIPSMPSTLSTSTWSAPRVQPFASTL